MTIKSELIMRENIIQSTTGMEVYENQMSWLVRSKTDIYDEIGAVMSCSEKLINQHQIQTEDFSLLIEMFQTILASSSKTLNFLQSLTQLIDNGDTGTTLVTNQNDREISLTIEEDQSVTNHIFKDNLLTNHHHSSNNSFLQSPVSLDEDSRTSNSDSFDQIYFIDTPKNVSKRRKYKKSGQQSSFEDSLKDLETEEIDLIIDANSEHRNSFHVDTKTKTTEKDEAFAKDSDSVTKETEVGDKLLSFADVCKQNVVSDLKSEDIPVQNTDQWRSEPATLETFEEENDDSVEKFEQSDYQVHRKEGNNQYMDHAEQLFETSQIENLSSFHCLEDEIPRTPCIPQFSRPICPDTIDVKLSRKLSILDKDKFLLEPISPIVNVNNEVLVQDDLIKETEMSPEKQDLSKTSLAVNSTFNTSGEQQDKCNSLEESDSNETSPTFIKTILGKGRKTPPLKLEFCQENLVFYFERCQGWGTVPKEGGNTLGMAGKHFHSEYLPMEDKENQEPALEKEHLEVDFGRGTRKSKRLSLNPSLPASSSTSSLTSSSSTTSSPQWTSSIQKPGVLRLTKVPSLSNIQEGENEPKVAEINDLPSKTQNRRGRNKMKRNSAKTFLVSVNVNESVLESDSSINISRNSSLNSSTSVKKGECGTRGMERIPSRKRKTLLKGSISELDPTEAEECRMLRDSRSVVGCSCYGGKCTSLETCSCAADGIMCHEEQEGSPCACSESFCQNPAGRYRFDRTKVNLHYVQTIMEIQGSFVIK